MSGDQEHNYFCLDCKMWIKNSNKCPHCGAGLWFYRSRSQLAEAHERVIQLSEAVDKQLAKTNRELDLVKQELALAFVELGQAITELAAIRKAFEAGDYDAVKKILE